jgi:integrase/recombinase XerD
MEQDYGSRERVDEWRLFGLAMGWSPSTFALRYTCFGLLRRHAGVPLNEVSAAQLAAFLASYEGKGTRALHWVSVRAYFSWLRRAGYRDDDPTDVVPRPRVPASVPRPVPTEAIDKALLGCRYTTTHAYIVLGAFAGLRVHEIAKLQGRDIDTKAGTLYVLGKGSKDAVLPLHPAIAALVTTFPANGYWFPGVDHGHVRSTTVSIAIRHAFDRVGVSMTAHQLRHWYGVEILRSSGGNLLLAQQMLRHASLNSTLVYTAIYDDDRRSALYLLPADLPIDAPPHQPKPHATISEKALTTPKQRLTTTPRQAEVLRLLGSGVTRAEAGRALKLKRGTIDSQLFKAARRLNVTAQNELLFKAAKAGWLLPDGALPGYPKPRLSHKQGQVLSLLVRGHSRHQVAAELDMAPTTVRQHLERMRHKLGAKTQAELVAKAVQYGLLTVDGDIIPHDPRALTPAEMAVLTLLCRGATGTQVIARLGLTKSSVWRHIRSIYAKLDVHSRPELVLKAIQGRHVDPWTDLSSDVVSP